MVTLILVTDPVTETIALALLETTGAGILRLGATIWLIVPVVEVALISLTNEFIPEPLSIKTIGLDPVEASVAFV